MGRLSRPGLARFAARRMATLLRPQVELTALPEMVKDLDVPVTVRDGTVLRVNVFRPAGAGPFPVIMSAHPYGKDRVPALSRSGRSLNLQYRLFPQPEVIRFSPWTGWEAPDPAVWTAQGYAVVNADLRGAGTSEGRCDLFSDQEAADYHDLIEWVGTQQWSTGQVGLDGVSYLAISQYKVAAVHPPHLAAICVWEGFSDIYRDWVRPGGVREDGFTFVWSKSTQRAVRTSVDLRAQIVARPEHDDWYQERTPRLEDITVPMLVCASFSDQSLHTRGSFEAYRRSGSAHKWLYTHRDGKWSHYYSDAATRERIAFFDHVLKDEPNGWADRAPVSIAVHEAGPKPATHVTADSWPPTDLSLTTLHLHQDATLQSRPDPRPGRTSFRTSKQTLAWTWTVPEDIDIIGPSALRLALSLTGAEDLNLFVAVRKARNGREVCFEGSYGYSLDTVTKGWQRLAHRELDSVLSTPLQPVHTHRAPEPLTPGLPTLVDVALLPHATRMRAGEELIVELRGRWPFPRDPWRGQFPSGYQRSKKATCTVHTGADRPATLLLGTRPV